MAPEVHTDGYSFFRSLDYHTKGAPFSCPKSCYFHSDTVFRNFQMTCVINCLSSHHYNASSRKAGILSVLFSFIPRLYTVPCTDTQKLFTAWMNGLLPLDHREYFSWSYQFFSFPGYLFCIYFPQTTSLSWSDQRALGQIVQPVATLIYPVFHFFLAILTTERPQNIIIPLAESRYTVSAVFSEPIQFSNPIKNRNEVSLAGNEVSLATEGKTLNNVGVNSLS